MANYYDNYKVTNTGDRLSINTSAGVPPTNAVTTANLNAPASSCTITANVAMVTDPGGSAVAWAPGDVMFYSDGFTIYDSTGATMNGWAINSTGAHRAAPQGVLFVRIPDVLLSSAGFAAETLGTFFWCFFNSLDYGIKVGVIDMNGNNGLGTFTGYASLGADGLNTNGVAGTLKHTEDGVCGRMTSCCYVVDDTNTGVVMISKPWGSSADNDEWALHRIAEISGPAGTAPGCPKLSSSSTDGVTQQIGTLTPGNDAGRNGIVRCTRVEASDSSNKIATIYVPAVGGPGIGQDVSIATVNILTLDPVNLILSNSNTFNTTMIDKGPLTFPAPAGEPSRYIAKWLEWSHTSDGGNGILYVPNFNMTLPGGDLDMNWYEIGLTNTTGAFGSLAVRDNANNKIWGGPSAAGRVIAGVWADPQNTGEIYIHTPEVMGTTASYGPNDLAWSSNYPEIYGEVGSSNIIQHCIMSDCNDPTTTAPSVWMYGTIDPSTLIRYGAPSSHYCSDTVQPPGDQKCITPCSERTLYCIDANRSLWVAQYIPGLYTSVRELTQFPLYTNLIDGACDGYTGQMFLYHGTGTSLKWGQWDVDRDIIVADVSVTANADLVTWASFIAFATPKIQTVTSVGAELPAASICGVAWFLALKAGSTEIYGIGKLSRPLATVSAYSALTDFNITSDFSGAVAGMTPVDMAMESDLEGLVYSMYVAVGKRLLKFTTAGGTWTILNDNPGFATNITSLAWSTDFAAPKLLAFVGAAGAQQTYEMNTTTGAGTANVGVETLPGNYPWAFDAHISFTEQHERYWSLAPLIATSTDIPGLDAVCAANDIFTWTNDCSSPDTPIGCYQCTASCSPTSWVEYAATCPCGETIDYMNIHCRYCTSNVGDYCKPFLPCCWNGDGPAILPGVGSNTGIVTGNVYSVSSGGTPVCATAMPTPNDSNRFLWMSMATANPYNGIVSIDDLSTGLCTIQTEITGPFNAQLEDIAFDKHGNCLITQNGELWWGGAWPGYMTPMHLVTNTFSTPKCLDTDYSINNYIIGADNALGNAQFNTYDHLSVPGSITLISNVTNATISVGNDISVDPSTGDWWLLGDVTGAGGTNDLISIDDATGNHTLVADLGTLLTLGFAEQCCGIEAIEFVNGLTTLYIITHEVQLGGGSWRIKLYVVENAALISSHQLYNPANGSIDWNDYPSGLAYNDICQKWLNNTPPATVLFPACDQCLADPGTENCCYLCTDCTDPANFFYSTTAALYPYSISSDIWIDASDVCWETNPSSICPAPVAATLAGGPFVDCPSCAIDPTIYYKLPNCHNPADILYTDDTFMPTIGLMLGTVLQIGTECFCREVQLNPAGPQGTEATHLILGQQIDCAHCRTYIQLDNCLGGGGTSPAVLYVDHTNSPTIAAAMALGQAHHVIVAGVGMVDCYTIVNACLGGTSTVYPTGSIATSDPNCNDCYNSGLTCVQATWCCDNSVVVTVYDTSGITAADNGLVVEADITILGVVHSGCWEIVSPGVSCDVNTIPDIDVNTINSSTVGTGAIPTCLDCVNSPCADPCVLLNPCDPLNPTITVSGSQGALIGTNVVDFVASPPGCYYVCDLNAIHGTYWFWGHEQGMDWATGPAQLNFNGQSDMGTASQAGIELYTWRSSAVHCVEKGVTFVDTVSGLSTTYLPGDMLFYSDGKYVYDSTHTLMTDQTGVPLPVNTPLLGGGGMGAYQSANGASQQCIVVPNADPVTGKTNGVYNEYWLFYQTVKDGPLFACRIDMRKNNGKGQVITASIDEVVEASSCEALCCTNTQAANEEWFVYDLPVMTHCEDYANGHIRGRKIDGVVGIGPSFVAGDLPGAMVHYGPSDPLSMAQVKLKVDYQNRQLGLLAHDGTVVNQCDSTCPGLCKQHLITILSLNMTSGTCTGPGGASMPNGFLGGSWSSVTNIYNASQAWMRDFEFSPSGDKYFTIAGGPNSASMTAELVRINCIDSFTSGVANTNVFAMNDTPLAQLPDMPANSANAVFDMAQGWDMQLAPDGKIYCVMNQGSVPIVWTFPSGNQPGNTSLLVIESPNDSAPASLQFGAGLDLGAWNLGSRQIGTGLPTYLGAPCPCDPLNITAPVVDNTYLSCADAACTTPPVGCYKLTECTCTGGTANNSCSVDDPLVMPPNMVTYGKSWSPVCSSGTPQRWTQIKDAVQALGTTGLPGTNQTVNFTYSFIMGGSNIVDYMGGSAGPTVAVEQLAGATGTTPACLSYPKTYIIDHTAWKNEIASMFAECKTLLEGMFNTTCGYGADLTITFTDLGYESGAMNLTSTISNPGNGTSFTDSAGITGIGDFRIGLTDWGFHGGCGCASGCQSGILAAAFNASLNSCDPGITKTQAYAGTLLFDVNEDWRSDLLGQVVVANSFSIKRTGIHEILHTLGYGHDFLTFGGTCNSLCVCPCYQSQGGCPNVYAPGACPGIIPNPDALMGPYATQQAFATDFPTGLLGPEGIYDRRATCGIYGEPDPNYGCMDGTCLAGCNYVIEYSDDPALAAYLGGTIIWDNGDAAGERCWEVEWESPCPAPPPPLVNPVNLVSGSALTDCIACEGGVGNCYELNLCPCNTVPGAPAQVITSTDLSSYCTSMPPATTVEIDLYPGACYEINCTPIVCPVQPAPVVVVVTATYTDCQACCDVNEWCYELCPCDPLTAPGSNTCAGLIEIDPGGNAGLTNCYHYYSVFANGISTNLHNTRSFAGVSAPPNGGCESSIPGQALQRLIGIRCKIAGSSSPELPLPGMPQVVYQQTSSWALCLADLIAAGYANAGDSVNDVEFNAAFIAAGGDFAYNGGGCFCSTDCVTVIDDLSANLGDVVTLGPGPPFPLAEDTCYVVGTCGLCTSSPGAACTPIGSVTLNPPFPDCTSCEMVTQCDCYRLVDCTDPLIVINNVCSSVDLNNAYINGDVIQINGNTTYCYHIECEDPLVCDPITCISVSVTNTFVSCAACLQAPLWECIPATGCNCVQSATGTHATQAACLAAPPCCPTVTEYECEAVTCNCIPCLTPPCAYDAGPTSAANLSACLADTNSCCINTDPTYNCIYDAGTNTYSCIDPGNGTGFFNNPGTALADCNAAVLANTIPCALESWNCDPVTGACTDPGDGTGTWNNTNGGLAACVSCAGCALDPDCPGTTLTFDCDPVYGCIQNWTGNGQYQDLPTCIENCTSHEPADGTFEGDCVNCFSEIEMKSLLEKVSDVCDECNLPYGLTEQEVTCDTPCFGNSNIYFFLDTTSAFGGNYLTKLQSILSFKVNVIEPAFALLKSENPTYGGHLYIIPGAWPAGGTFGPCNDVNNTGAAAPGSLYAPEAWLQWAQYPLSGNAGANGAGPNPMATGTLPAAQRVILQHTMVDAVGGAPFDCNGGAYDPLVHGPLLEQILILPGSYSDDGFTQVNPWQDGLGKEGFSDPYHEFEGNDLDAICILFQDESVEGYYSQFGVAVNTADAFTNPLGTCGAPLINGAPATDWNGYGLAPGGVLSAEWIIDYHNYMSLHEFGWDASGVANVQPHNVTQKVFLYAGSYIQPAEGGSGGYHCARWMYHYHIYQAIGGTKGTVDANGHVDCADYLPVPAVFGHQCYAVTDHNIPNMYMGILGGGDPALTTGYKGGSLSEYDFQFFIPDFEITSLTSEDLYELMKEYLSDCEDS